MKNTPETPIPPSPEPSTTDCIDMATIELLARWRAEDATDDPEELRLAEQELAEYKQAMNDNRVESGGSLVFP
jgi:hypothetical protein